VQSISSQLECQSVTLVGYNDGFGGSRSLLSECSRHVNVALMAHRPLTPPSAGMTLALATTLPTLAVAGILVVGLAISGMAPLAQSVAWGLVPGRTGAAVSVVVTISYGWLLLAGPAVGGFGRIMRAKGVAGEWLCRSS
jgi:hypothetical protein